MLISRKRWSGASAPEQEIHAEGGCPYIALNDLAFQFFAFPSMYLPQVSFSGVIRIRSILAFSIDLYLRSQIFWMGIQPLILTYCLFSFGMVAFNTFNILISFLIAFPDFLCRCPSPYIHSPTCSCLFLLGAVVQMNPRRQASHNHSSWVSFQSVP
jgi:hypothetical protein